jgi:hypothetical protein
MLVRIASFNGEEDNSIYRFTTSTKENGSRDKNAPSNRDDEGGGYPDKVRTHENESFLHSKKLVYGSFYSNNQIMLTALLSFSFFLFVSFPSCSTYNRIRN